MKHRTNIIDEHTPPAAAVLRLDPEARRIIELRLKGSQNAPVFVFDIGEWMSAPRDGRKVKVRP
jgi:hypothetical protein